MNSLSRRTVKISRRSLFGCFMAWPAFSLMLTGLKPATDVRATGVPATGVSDEIVEINGWILKKGDLA